MLSQRRIPTFKENLKLWLFGVAFGMLVVAWVASRLQRYYLNGSSGLGMPSHGESPFGELRDKRNGWERDEKGKGNKMEGMKYK